MSKSANKRLIGVFVLGAIALLVISVIALGSGKFFRKTLRAVCFFEGSVGGLNVGAPVVFNGVRIGSVTNLVLRYNTIDSRATIPVYIEIDPQRVETIGTHLKSFEQDPGLLISHGLRARLELQSLVTGKLQVSFGFYPDRPAEFVGTDQKYPEIPTIPSTVQEITKRIEHLPLEEMVRNITTAAEGINRVVNSSSSDIRQTFREAQKLIRDIDAKAATLTSSVDGTVKDVQRLVQNIDRQVGPLGPSIQRTLSSIEKTSDEGGITLRMAQQTLGVLESDMGEDSTLMYELKKAVKEVGTAAKAIQSLAKTLEQQPESLLLGKKQK